MSDKSVTYIDCASGQSAQTDCCVRVVGSLVEILGHSLMHFTPEDAAVLGTVLITAAQQAGWQAPIEQSA
jgi:hypothetical protein